LVVPRVDTSDDLARLDGLVVVDRNVGNRVAREPDADAHPVRQFYSGGYPGAYVQWPSIIAAAHGIAAERAPVPPPTVLQWGHR
jgi:hypothetical protein